MTETRTAEQQLDEIFAHLDTAGVAEQALELLEHLGAVLNDTAVTDRAAALRRRLEQGLPDSRNGRGRCPRCLRGYALNADGEVRAHRTAAGRPCKPRTAR
jgi:hypothetical protein